MQLPEPAVEGPVSSAGRHFQIVELPAQKIEAVILRLDFLLGYHADAPDLVEGFVGQIFRRLLPRLGAVQEQSVGIHQDILAVGCYIQGNLLHIEDRSVQPVAADQAPVEDVGRSLGAKLQLALRQCDGGNELQVQLFIAILHGDLAEHTIFQLEDRRVPDQAIVDNVAAVVHGGDDIVKLRQDQNDPILRSKEIPPAAVFQV